MSIYNRKERKKSLHFININEKRKNQENLVEIDRFI